MLERAHPEDPDFQDRWVWRRRFRGLIPWPYFKKSPWRQGLITRYQFCQPYAAGKRVLDVPCGVGWGTSLLQGARQLVGLDLIQEAIQYAQTHYGDKADFIVGDMKQLPFSDESFDLVICLEGIEHVPIEVGTRFIQEAVRILAPSGHIILTSPIPDPKRPPNPYHIHEYALDELQALIKPYFETESHQVQTVGGVAIIYLVGKVRKTTSL